MRVDVSDLVGDWEPSVGATDGSYRPSDGLGLKKFRPDGNAFNVLELAQFLV